MTRARAELTRWAIVAGLACAVAACERAKPAAAGAASSGSPGAGSDADAAGVSWDDASAGPVLFVAGSNETEAAIVFPHYTDSTLGTVSALDTGIAAHARVDLFTRAGSAGQATITPTSAGVLGGDCTAWPTARVHALDHAVAGVPGAWSVGFVTGHATAMPMDSMSALSPIDSARRAADLARLASSLPNDTAADFRGLPYDIQRAGRFSIAPGIDGIVAILVRRVNQEANPREEHLLLIVERDSTRPPPTGAPAWIATYSERTSGAEDDVEANETLTAVHLGPARTPAVVISRDYGDGGVYSLIDRATPGHWRLRWSSAYTGC